MQLFKVTFTTQTQIWQSLNPTFVLLCKNNLVTSFKMELLKLFLNTHLTGKSVGEKLHLKTNMLNQSFELGCFPHVASKV